MMESMEGSREPDGEASEPAKPLTIADVIARLEADDGLGSARRAEMLSALRSICRVLNANPQFVPAEPRNLRQRLHGVTHAAAGVSRGRWANIRSLILAAIMRAGIRAMPGGSRQPLAFSWEVLAARLPDKQFRFGLSRFMRFCSANQITPDDVDAAVFEQFRHALENESLVRHPKLVYRTACVLWNRASKSIPGWPAVEVPVPNGSRRSSLRYDDLPVSFRADAEAYLTHLGNQDPFADDYVASLRPATIEARRNQILQIATAAVRSGCPVEEVTGLAALVKPENAKRALRFFWNRAGQVKKESVHQFAILLRSIARYWAKASASDLDVIDGLCRGLAIKNTGLTDKNRQRLRQFDNADNLDALLGLPDRIFRRVRKTDRGGRRDAVRVVCAVAIELLTVAPMRIKNLTLLEAERHLVHTRLGPSPAIHLVIPGEETKNGEPFEVALPGRSAKLVAEYLRNYRHRLTPVASPWLFPGYGGKQRNIDRFSGLISAFVLRETGVRINVHLFRHLAVNLHLDANPEDVETARRILGHKSLRTTLRAYADMKTAAAFKRYDEMISTLRERGDKHPPTVRRRKKAA
jgi:integrase